MYKNSRGLLQLDKDHLWKSRANTIFNSERFFPEDGTDTDMCSATPINTGRGLGQCNKTR